MIGECRYCNQKHKTQGFQVNSINNTVMSSEIQSFHFIEASKAIASIEVCVFKVCGDTAIEALWLK